MSSIEAALDSRRTPGSSVGVGASIGVLGGLVGLGGAEFRLPVLVGWFRFPTLEAVILNKVTSLVVLTFALLFRSAAIPWRDVLANDRRSRPTGR